MAITIICSFQAGLKLKLQEFLRLWQQVRCDRSCGHRSVLEAILQFGQAVYSRKNWELCTSHNCIRWRLFLESYIIDVVGSCSSLAWVISASTVWPRPLGHGSLTLFLLSFFYFLRIDLAFLKTNNGRFHQRACGGAS